MMKVVVIVFALIAGLGLAAAACNSTSSQNKNRALEHRYALRGKVISIDKQQRQIVVDHEDIPGFMAAMAMPYSVKEPFILSQVSPADQISADVVVNGSEYWLEKVTIVKKADPNAAASSSPPQVHPPRPGDVVPDFVLVNQDGKQIHLADFRGESVLLTFIYTRCPLPDFCPAMSARFSVIEEKLQKNKEAIGKTHLLSISFDPRHDTPKVLYDYGSSYLEGSGKQDFHHWEFAAPPEESLKDVAAFFGLIYLPDENQIAHSMSTAIISPDGKIYKWYGGNDWQTSEVMTDLINSSGH